MNKYRDYEVVRIRLIHTHAFFEFSDKEMKDVLSTNKGKTTFVKTRPAIIIRTFESKNGKSSRYLVIPLTSKRSVENWIGTRTALRIKFKNKSSAAKCSYLMLDSLMTIEESQIVGIYKNKKGAIEISEDQQLGLEKLINRKLGHITKPFSVEEAVELGDEENNQDF